MGLARNSLFNFAGALVPALAALFTVPVIVSRLGADHYGVLVLVTSIVGYFAILDINVTAGAVKYVAEYHARQDHRRLSEVLSFGGLLYLLIGSCGGIAIIVYSQALATKVFNVPVALEAEAVAALRWAGAGFLLGQLQVFLQSVMQALQRYDVSGTLEGIFGTAASLITVAVVLLGGNLPAIIAARLALSLLNVAWLLRTVRHLLPEASLQRPSAEVVRQLAAFSGFSYLTRLASISATNTDKLFVGAMVDMKALAFYAVPFMLVNRIYALAFRLAQVIFPVASALAAQDRHMELKATYLDATRIIGFVNASICLLLVALAPELLHYWAGYAFGTQAVFVMICLSVAVFMDSLTNLPSLLNDGLGRPHHTGVAAVLRAGAGIAATYLAARYAGIEGVAAAQLAVSTIAAVTFLVYIHAFSLPVRLSEVARFAFLPSLPPIAAALGFALWSASRAVFGLIQAALLACALVFALAAYGWWVVLPDRRRAPIAALVRTKLPWLARAR